MREIRFRWFGQIDSEDKPRMHDVVGIHWGAGVVELWDDEGSTYAIGDGLEQYTGLQDKNKAELYENDILQDEGGGRGIIIWNDGAFWLSTKEPNHKVFQLDDDGNEIWPVEFYDNVRPLGEAPLWNLTKIGNADENPELIECHANQIPIG